MAAKSATTRLGHVRRAPHQTYRTQSFDNGIYQVDSGQKIYETARKIAEVGLAEFIRINPPPPPFKRPD